mgnify:CR=1 FL=1
MEPTAIKKMIIPKKKVSFWVRSMELFFEKYLNALNTKSSEQATINIIKTIIPYETNKTILFRVEILLLEIANMLIGKYSITNGFEILSKYAIDEKLGFLKIKYSEKK